MSRTKILKQQKSTQKLIDLQYTQIAVDTSNKRTLCLVTTDPERWENPNPVKPAHPLCANSIITGHIIPGNIPAQETNIYFPKDKHALI